MKEEFLDNYYIDMKDSQSVSRSSLNLYMTDLEKYVIYLIKNGIRSLKEIDRSNIVDYLLDMQKEGRAASTLARNLSSIKSYHKYLYENGYKEDDPSLNLKTPKIDARTPDILTIDEVTELIEVLDGKNFKEIRDRAMLELLYSTGIRINELIDLNVEDIDFKSEYLYIRGAEERAIPIGKPAIRAINRYIENYHNGERPLFINNRGGRLSRQGFWKNLKGYVEELDIKKNVTPQTLRQSFIVHLIQNGADLKTIQKISGHANISSIQNYIAITDKKDLREVYNKTHPRA